MERFDSDLESIPRLSPEAEWIMDTINAAQEKRTYGTITFIFEKGKITRAKIEESLKAPKA